MSSYRILIIDDSRDLSRLLKSALLTLDASFEVVEVPSGEEALLEINRKLPDLFVVDIRLPGISGFEFLEKIQSRYGNIKFIIITGSTDAKMIAQAKKLAGENFFKKPLHMGEFLTAVEHCLGLTPSIQNSNIDVVALDTIAARADNIKDLLPVLQKNLGATGIFWLDEDGKIIEQVGERTSDEFASLLFPSILNMSQVIEAISDKLKRTASLSITAIKGSDYDILLSTHGAEGMILMILQQLAPPHLAVAFDLLKNIYPGKENYSDDAGIVDTVEDDLSPKDFDKLLASFEARQVDQVQSDTYWDGVSMTGNEGLHASNPDVLTYDQADEMGLAPGEE